MPAVLRAQATAPAVALGSVAIGSTGTGTVTFTFSGSTTVASVSVVTQGVTGLDFTAGTQTTGACTATTYAAAATCTVVVNFTPQAAGLRLGAVLLLDGSSNKLAVAPVSGSGSGATFETDSTATTTLIANDAPANITIDASGNLYVSSVDKNTAIKLTPAGVQTNIAGSAVYPGQVAVDGAGYIYIFDNFNYDLYRTDPVSGTQSVLVSGLSIGYGLAIDPQGNIYLGQGNPATSASILKYSPSGTLLTTYSLTASGQGFAFDAAGDLYYVAAASGIYKLAAGATTPTFVADPSNPANYASLALDAAGNLYYANENAPLTLYQIPAGSSTANVYATISSGYFLGVAVDANGNLYYGANGSLYKVDRTHPTATLSGTTAIGSTSTEKTQTYRNIGSAAPAISAAVASANGKVGPSNTCSAANAVAINATCVASLEFAPIAHGSPQSATLTLTGPLTAPVFTLTAYVSGDPAKLGFTSGPPVTIVSGSNPGTVTVAIQDNSGTTVPGQTDSLTLTITGPSAPTPTTVSAVNGVATFNLSVDTLTTVGTYTFTVTDNTRSLTSAATTETVLPKYFTVVPGSLTTTASAQDSIVVTAYDNAGNQATAYAGYVALTSTDSAATLPAPFSLSSGQGTAGVTFNTVGMQTVTAKDSATGLITGTSASITVTADPIYTVSTATDPGGSGTAANCPNQNVASPPSTASCSLRDAFAAANALNSTGVTSAQPIINFSAALVAAHPILSIGSVITPTANFKLVGPGAASLTISPSAAGFSFINSSTASIAMTVSGLTISGFSRTGVNGGAWSATGTGHVSTFTNDIFTANSASGTYSGGAIFETSSSAVNLSGSTFTGNSSGYYGGAVALSSVTQGTISTSTFGSAASQNTATTNGGSLYVSNSTVTITGSTFSGNGTTTNANFGGAAYFSTCTCTLTNNAFSSNTATYAGGALYVSAGTLGTTATPSSGNIFSANQVTNQASTNTNGGGAIYFYLTNVSAVLTNSLFSGNTVAGTYATGGAIDIYSVAYKPNITITNSLFTGNKASASTFYAYGGAIYQSPGNSSTNISTLTLTGDTFTGNSANTSATSVNEGAYGGAVNAGTFATDVFYNDTVTANQAKDTSGNTNAAVGGGIYSFCNAAQYCPGLNNTIVAANTSLSDGLASNYPDLDNNFLANASCSSPVCNNASTAGGTSVDTGILLSALGNYGGTAIGPVGTTVVPGSYAAANGQLIL